jgi:hypothetical protein
LGPLGGLLTGLMFVVVQVTTAHVGDNCKRLSPDRRGGASASPPDRSCVAT